MKLTNLSASRIKIFKECPLKYKAIYEKGLKSPEHPAGTMGKALHSAAENGIKKYMSGNDVNFQNEVKESCKKYNLNKDYTIKAIELMDNALKWDYLLNIAFCKGIEIKFDCYLSDNTCVKGYIDRIDIFKDSADIIDLKTQKYAFKQDELKSQWQSLIYNWAARKLYLEITGDVKISYWVLRHKIQSCYMTSEDAKYGHNKLLQVANEIRSCKNPKPKMSPLCQWCPIYKNCEATNQIP